MRNIKSLVVGAVVVAGSLAVTMPQSDIAWAQSAKKTVKRTTTKTTTKKTVKKNSKRRVLAGGLVVEDLRTGTGAVAKAGQNVSVHYRGRLTNGQIFDESYKRGQPFQFSLGAGQVIQGWDMGVAGMKVGGKRRLEIPRLWAMVPMAHLRSFRPMPS